MNIDKECVGCIINQSRRVAEAIDADKKLETALISEVEKMGQSFDFSQNPPEIASDVYKKMAEIAHKEDLYAAVKVRSTQQAKSLMPSLRVAIKKSETPLLTATKVAVAGNVIDLAAAVSFDLDEELGKIFHTDFAHNDFAILKQQLASATTLLYIGDNVGEHLFDYLYIEALQNLYPKLDISYMVRGNPIINDVTMKEAKEAGFDTLCHLIDSGVNTPGFVYSRANEASQKLFDNADLVITKGMGNYECLSPTHRTQLCFLLKVKCNVVANSLGKEVGDIICKMI